MYNSQLKYIVKDGSAVWLHILSSPFFVCLAHWAECDCSHNLPSARYTQNVTAVTFCTVHDTHRMWLQSHSAQCTMHTECDCSHSAQCTIHTECDCIHILHNARYTQNVIAVTFCTMHDTHRMWPQSRTIHDAHRMWPWSHSAQCTIHTECDCSHILHSARYTQNVTAVTFCTMHDTHTKQGLDGICSHTAEPSLTMYFNWLL